MNERPRVVGLVSHRDRADAQRLAARAEQRLTECGVTVRRWDGEDGAQFADGLDLAISLGGDGTMLLTVDLVYESGAAVLGVNVGHLGYLTEVQPGELDHALDRVLASSAPRVPPRAGGGRLTRPCSSASSRAGSCSSPSTSTARSSRRTRPTA